MAKKNPKNTRAARRAPSPEAEELAEKGHTSGRTMVLEKLAEISARQNDDKPTVPRVREGGITKKRGQKKKDQKKTARAEMVKDMLSEKIEQSKNRHKAIRKYRKEDEEPKAES